MTFPSQFVKFADKKELLKAYKGKHIDELPTPSLIVDRKQVAANCKAMFDTVEKLGFDFRPHVKTHKTTEATLLELGEGTDFHTDRIVISTLAEAWNLIPLCEKGLINDILFSMPVVQSRLSEILELSKHVKNMRLMLDNLDQLDALIEFNKKHGYTGKWSLFIKINMGSDRAGFELDSPDLKRTLERISTDAKNYVELYGFYCHAGHSYGCHTMQEAGQILIDEITSANGAAKLAKSINDTLDLVLSVGATPTAHAATYYDASKVGHLYGKIELHAGNFALCDLQQVGTGSCKLEWVASRVLGEIVSAYPGRGDKKPGEELTDVGVLCIGRETGAIPGYGKVCSPKKYENWIIGRISQEHGVMTVYDDSKETPLIPVGTKIQIYPQHICIAGACYPWYFVVDGGDEVVDIWVPWRGW